jgi:hypothetical protein
MSLISATIAAANLRLLFEPCHRLAIGPARTIQLIVMLVPIFLQPTPHVSADLVTSKCSTSHD